MLFVAVGRSRLDFEFLKFSISAVIDLESFITT